MKATGLFVQNFDEREQAEKLGVVVPEVEIDEDDFFFELLDVKWMHLTTEGNIFISVFGRTQLLKYEQSVFDRIKKHLMRNV